MLRSGVVGRGQSRVSPVQGHQAGQGLERQRPVLVQPGGEKASVCVCVCVSPSYCWLQLPSGQHSKNRARLFPGEQQWRDKRQWMLIATKEVLVRYWDKLVPHSDTGMCTRKDAGTGSQRRSAISMLGGIQNLLGARHSAT